MAGEGSVSTMTAETRIGTMDMPDISLGHGGEVTGMIQALVGKKVICVAAGFNHSSMD